ncbi:hypothetical protein RFI_12481 [Reticulomyxa filosa]|uniref:Uncharacterized protein n=1 Tax=Reticulomyxa filosa TaxID=46433 RepID=X6NH46_RETFI|nr:hypothetical protein RFI_12481 [Reticulomyxa filosa]|eukprot:ETO24677.1 hypothetical protein RFI_12481 [Reticulomyxa filosa]
MKRHLSDISGLNTSREEEPTTKEANPSSSLCAKGCSRPREEGSDFCCTRCENAKENTDRSKPTTHRRHCNKRYAAFFKSKNYYKKKEFKGEAESDVTSSLPTLTSSDYGFEEDDNDWNSKNQMRNLVEAIKEKDEWEKKIENEEIVTKWRKEATKKSMKVGDFESAITMLKQMRDKTLLTTGDIDYSKVPTPPSTLVLEDPNLIDLHLHQQLITYVTKHLEPKREEDKDWHPDTKEMVLDLVHPSLFCYIHGVSPVSIGEEQFEKAFGSNKKELEEAIRSMSYEWMRMKDVKEQIVSNSRYQWLPSEVKILTTEGKVKAQFESYINNLDKGKHKPLYEIIERVFAAFVPMFEKILDSPLPHNCQVIVKLANIHLDAHAKKSEYKGGVWHIEGLPHEHIIASGIFYYDVVNVKNSYLEFRTKLEEDDIAYEQDDHIGVWKEYQMTNGDPLNRHQGAVHTVHGKCVVFPNNLQHRVTRFELKDKQANGGKGHRKILVFFLIDPQHRILSTKDVPIQQQHLIGQTVHACLDSVLNRDVANIIMEYVPTLTLEEAKQHRSKLMFGRKFYVNGVNDQVYEREFSLCEH